MLVRQVAIRPHYFNKIAIHVGTHCMSFKTAIPLKVHVVAFKHFFTPPVKNDNIQQFYCGKIMGVDLKTIVIPVSIRRKSIRYEHRGVFKHINRAVSGIRTFAVKCNWKNR
jgi:hypothetical protein